MHRLHSLLPVSLSASRAVVNNSGLEDFHEVLLVAFAAQPVDPPMYWNTYDLQHGPQSVQYIRSSFFPNASDDQIGALLLAGSALSLFSMAHIDAQFNNVIRNCLEGHGTRGPSHFMRSTDREYIGCVHEAYLYEVTSVNDSRQLESKLLAPLGTPLTGISLDITGTVAFVTSLNKVFRVELSNCDTYHTCKTCLEARDPYCGWCMSEGRCSRLDQCQIPSQPVMPYGNRAKHDQRKRRWDSPGVTQNNDYCANKFTPGYAMPSSAESWLPYTSPVSNCPTIRAIHPPGIQERRKAKGLEHSKDIQSSDSTGISTIVLHLEDSLVNDPRFRAFILNGSGLEKSLTDNFDSVNARHLVCAFRSAPDQWMQSESVLAGAWLPMSQMHSLLTNIRPGPVLTSTIARPILSANGSLEVHCDAPSLHQLPSLPARQASLPLVLWLDWFTPEKTKHNNRNENTQMKSAGHYASLVSGLFAIYDCARLADCRACSHSRFHCAWCLLEDRCVPSSWLSSTTAEQLCTRSIHLSELGTTNQEDAAPLIVSSGRRPLQHFTCEEGCNGQRVIPFYDPEKSLVICRNLTINVTEQLGNLQRHISNWSEDTTWSRTGINCSLNLYWHGHDSRNQAGHRMINEDNVKVEVYSCEMLAEHCDECLALPSRFGCGWCTSTLSGQSTTDTHVMCTTRAQCLTRKSSERVTSPAIRPKWLQSGSLCPNPQITSIYPLNGTLTGRPVLHVRGINLGRTVSDLVGNVQLDGPQPVACHVQTQAYFSSRAFTCQLDSAAHFTLPAHGRLKVVVSKYKYQAFSPVFHFLAPRLYEVHPERGPVAGGTRLKLHGSNLNIGANRTVWLLSVGPNANSQRVSLGDTLHRANTSVPCSVESETPELIVCRTGILPFNMSAVIASQRDSRPTANRVRKHVETNPSPQNAPIERGARSDVIKSDPIAPFMPMSLVLMHDLTPTFPIRPFTYLYSPNPQISTVRRQNVLVSGGTTIRAEGDFLFVVEKPRVLIYYNGSEYISVHSDPFVTPFPDGIRVEELDNLGIPPATDNTPEQNTHQKRHAPASDNPQSSRSTPGVEHPDQNHIESESKVRKSDSPSASVHQLLRLFGQFHTLVLAPELQAPDELIVRVGNSQRCLVTSVIDTEIRCDLDQSQLVSTEDYPVEVQFGRFLIYRPGRVRFVRLGHTALRNNLVISLTAVVVFLTLVALIAFAIWRRFNRHKHNYQVRLGQKYAEHESRVLRVFREDFMELQSNMQELSQEVKKHNLPYRDYRTFCLFSLFPEYHCELMIPVDPHTCGIHNTTEIHRSGLSIDDSNQSVPTHPLLSPFIVPIESHDAASRGISLFNELICNHQFLCLCIRVLEEDDRITARDKSRIASLLCAALQPKMVYLTRYVCMSTVPAFVFL
ncbi:Plexin A [Fasciola gigantica]|uniref:Plexin A n=1 Tax=Fasciola gigantica TaxID=46835 RepID=A0A504YZS7_FASGI|nr:Plexin A [Fasciola gigantica]